MSLYDRRSSASRSGSSTIGVLLPLGESPLGKVEGVTITLKLLRYTAPGRMFLVRWLGSSLKLWFRFDSAFEPNFWLLCSETCRRITT